MASSNVTEADWNRPCVFPVVHLKDEKTLKRDARVRLNLETDPNFKPASAAQIAAWSKWLSSPEAAKAAEHNAAFLKDIGKHLKDTKKKFDPIWVEREIDCLPGSKKTAYLYSYEHLMYLECARRQQRALEDYTEKANDIDSAKEYEDADKAYTELSENIKQHGQLCETPRKIHKKPGEEAPDAPRKPGRRAARKARNESEKSEAAKKQYSRAELRALVRADEEEDYEDEKDGSGNVDDKIED